MPENISDKRLGGCAISGALAVTAFITDAVTVLHAPVGCSHQIFSMLHALIQDTGQSSFVPAISSNISDKDVIFGGEQRLTDALDVAAARNPALIAVCTSCVPETIGDDCAGVCSSHPASDHIVYLPTSGFIGGTAEDGENTALIGLASLAHQETAIPRTVAIIGEKNLESEVEENYQEIVRLLSRLGITVLLRFCRNITAADIQSLGKAACYLIRDRRVLRAGAAIAERFGRPYIPEYPRGFSGSLQFLQDAGTACGVPDTEISVALNAERAYQQEMLQPFAELAGSTISLGIEPFDGTFAVAREAMAMLGITEGEGGMQVKLPFYLPVGVSGTVKMLYLWRRDHRT